MSHIPRIPDSLEDPGVTDLQCWALIAGSLCFGAVVTGLWSLHAGLAASWLAQIAGVLVLWVHRRRAVQAAYHSQRRRDR